MLHAVDIVLHVIMSFETLLFCSSNPCLGTGNGDNRHTKIIPNELVNKRKMMKHVKIRRTRNQNLLHYQDHKKKLFPRLIKKTKKGTSGHRKFSQEGKIKQSKELIKRHLKLIIKQKKEMHHYT